MTIETTLQKIISEDYLQINYNELLKSIFSFYASSESKTALYCCSYVPVEILMAGGLQPIRIFGSNLPVTESDAHIQTYGCHVIRSVLDLLLTREAPDAELIFFAHTCDSMQCLPEIIRFSGKMIDVECVMTPTSIGSVHSRDYYISELQRIAESLGKITGVPITTNRLKDSIRRQNTLGALFRKLAEKRTQRRLPGFSRKLYMLQVAASMLPQEIITPYVNELLRIADAAPACQSSAARIFLSGGVLFHPEIFDLIEEMDSHVIGDDLCTGSRFFFEPIPALNDPFAALAEYYLKRYPCPAKYGFSERAESLLNMVTSKNAHGVVFLPLKFCDPFTFELPNLSKLLSDNNIPSTFIEIDPQTFSLDAVRTRLQAFLESLPQIGESRN